MDKKGWNNHENTNEEALRRRLINLEKEVDVLRADLQQATKMYYNVIKTQGWGDSVVATKYVYERLKVMDKPIERFLKELEHNYYVDTNEKIGGEND